MPPSRSFRPVQSPLHPLYLFSVASNAHWSVQIDVVTSSNRTAGIRTRFSLERVSLFSFLSSPYPSAFYPAPFRCLPLHSPSRILPFLSSLLSPVCSSLGLFFPRADYLSSYLYTSVFYRSLLLPLLLWSVFSFGRLSRNFTAASLSFYLVDSFFIALPRLPFLAPASRSSRSPRSRILFWFAASSRSFHAARRLVYSPLVSIVL